jgi:hypothetical protein
MFVFLSAPPGTDHRSAHLSGASEPDGHLFTGHDYRHPPFRRYFQEIRQPFPLDLQIIKYDGMIPFLEGLQGLAGEGSTRFSVDDDGGGRFFRIHEKSFWKPFTCFRTFRSGKRDDYLIINNQLLILNY